MAVVECRMRRTLTAAVLGVALIAMPGVAHAAPTTTAPDWTQCEEDSQGLPERLVCATLPVPLNWAKPNGPTIDLRVAKLPAADPSRRIGSLFVNPGGPGGSGVWMVYGAEDTFSPDLIDRFDIVSFDPRGQAASNPVLCDSDAYGEQAALQFPQNNADYRALRKANRALAESCYDLTGPLVGHVDTKSVVRDMDAVRKAIGEAKISYYGVSYGTMIGQQYAQLYPNRLRALVLDSNMDHAQNIFGYQKGEALAMEGSFLQFAAWCERTEGCVLGDRDVAAYFDELYQKAEAGEIPISAENLLWETFSAMYDPNSWYALAESLQSLGSAGAGRGEPIELGYLPVMCSDFQYDLGGYPPVRALENSLKRIAPITRLNPLAWTDLTSCQNWPDQAINPPHRLNASPDLPPILMTNSRYDVATPYEWATSLASQLPSATLLTYDGVGHGDYWLSPCAQSAIDTYLLTKRVPPKGTHCPAIFPSDEGAAAKRVPGLVSPIRPGTR